MKLAFLDFQMKVLYALVEIKNILTRQPDKQSMVEFDLEKIITMDQLEDVERRLVDKNYHSALVRSNANHVAIFSPYFLLSH